MDVDASADATGGGAAEDAAADAVAPAASPPASEPATDGGAAKERVVADDRARWWVLGSVDANDRPQTPTSGMPVVDDTPSEPFVLAYLSDDTRFELWLDPRVQHLAVGCSTWGLFRVMPPALLASRAHLPTTADDTTRTAFRACAPR